MIEKWLRQSRGTAERSARALQKLGLRALARLYPAWAQAWALQIIATPRRPDPPYDPSPPGSRSLAGQRFAVYFRGLPLAAWQWGSGPTVVLSHGWSGNAGHMTPFVVPLVGAGYRVVAFDHAAHGASDGAQTNMLEFRDGLLAVVRAVGPVTAIIAHSLGATGTILALDRGLVVDRVVLLAPPLDPVGNARAFAHAIGLPAAVSQLMTERLRAFVSADLGARGPEQVAAEQDLAALFIHDRTDRAVPFASTEALAASWRGSRFHPTNNLGHLRLLSNRAVLSEVIAFVKAGPPHSG